MLAATTPRRPRDERGFTLIELMISLVIFSFAIAGVLSVAVSMTQGLHEQRAAVETENAARQPLGFLQDAIRQASPGSPTMQVQDVNFTTCPVVTAPNLGAISVTDGGTTSSDILDIIYASGAVVTSLRTPYTTGTTSITVGDASQLATGDNIVISDTSQGTYVKITNVVGNVLTLGPQCTSGLALPTGGYPAGALVIRSQHARFFIANIVNPDLPNGYAGFSNSIPTLMMNPTGDPAQDSTSATEPLAEGVEDFEVVLGWDLLNAGTVPPEVGTGANDDSWIGNVGVEAQVTAPATAALRAIRVTLVARALTNYKGGETLFTRPAIENRAAAGVTDGYRRRVLKTTVEIRNMGGSP